jgi:HlyD family secretion protein
MNRNYFYVILAISVACVFLIIFSMTRWDNADKPYVQDQAVPHPLSPYPSYVSAVGVVEAGGGNIAIGTPLNRIVKKVYVEVGAKVKKDEPLIQLENNDLKADFQIQQAAYNAAVAQLNKLEAYPRPEDLLTAKASLLISQVEMEQSKSQNDMVLKLPDPRAISEEERNKRQFNYEQAEAKWVQAKADLAKIEAGTWAPDLEIAKIDVKQAEASLNRIKTNIQQTQINSPIEGTVLQAKIHEGELTSPDKAPLMIIGNADQMNLRVSINQFDIPHFSQKNAAVAFLQGDARFEYPLEFQRVEMYLVDKGELTHNIMDKVDTQVLQVIYQIKKNDHPIYVGQQMDVFIDNETSR